MYLYICIYYIHICMILFIGILTTKYWLHFRGTCGIFKSCWSWGTCGRFVWWNPSCRRSGVPRWRMWGLGWECHMATLELLVANPEGFLSQCYVAYIFTDRKGLYPSGRCMPQTLWDKAAFELRSRQDRTNFVMNLSLQWQVAGGCESFFHII